MGYEKSFTPTEEAVDKLKQNVSKLYDSYDSFKIELKTYCMLDHSTEKISDVLFKIKYYLTGLKYDVRSECYRISVEQHKEYGYVWFCGWEHSHLAPESDYDEVLDYVLEKLVFLTCVVKTPDWFDDSEKFYEKLNEIDSIIDYFCDEVTTIIDYEIMDMLKDYEDKEEEDTEDEEDRENVWEETDGKVSITGETTSCIKSVDAPKTWTVTIADLNSEYCTPTDSKE